jgi:hypothetical protein
MNKIREGFDNFYCTFDLWCGLMRSYGCTEPYQNFLYKEFFEELNYGWYKEYVYDFDDWYNPTISKERKLRLSEQ